MAKLFFHYSAMNAGKSTLLLQVAHNYLERGLHPYLAKSVLDTRGEANTINSPRVGLAKDCTTFAEDENLLDTITLSHDKQAIDCVLIDEAQFLSADQVWQLAAVVDELNIPVMTYGLRTDFQGKLFPGSGELMAIADELREIRTIDESGKKATMVVRLDEHGEVVQDGPQNLVGDNDIYKSVTRKRWRKLMGK